MNISAIQFKVTRNIEDNYNAISRGLDKAIANGADLLVMPEGSLSGYTHEFSRENAEKFEKKLIEKSTAGKINIALSTCSYDDDGRCYNQIKIYNRDGILIGTHAKILRCVNSDNFSLGEKMFYSTKDLKTVDIDGIKFGCLICNDLWANPQCTEEDDPHLTRQLAKMGAKIIIHAVNSGCVNSEFMKVAKQFHESNLKMRASANNLWIVTVNSSYDDYPCSSRSGVVSPNGEFVFEVDGMGEQFFMYEIKLS